MIVLAERGTRNAPCSSMRLACQTRTSIPRGQPCPLMARRFKHFFIGVANRELAFGLAIRGRWIKFVGCGRASNM